MSEFPEVKQKFDGLKSYQLWEAAQENQLELVVVLLDPTERPISVDLIGAGKTALDFSVCHKNQKMAELLLAQGAKLCASTPEEFENCFPGTFLTVMRNKALNIAQKPPAQVRLQTEVPEVTGPLARLDHLPNHLEAMTARVREVAAELKEFKKCNEEIQKTVKRFYEADRENQREALEKEFQQATQLSQKPTTDWTQDEVVIWFKIRCSGCDPHVFKFHLVTGQNLIALSMQDLEEWKISQAAAEVIHKEIQKLKHRVPTTSPKQTNPTRVVVSGSSVRKSYESSNYKPLITIQTTILFQDQIFLSLRQFIEFYCKQNNIQEQEGLNFFGSIQTQVIEKDLSPAAIFARLWQSTELLNKTPLRSMLCDVLRDDSIEALKAALPLIKGIDYLPPSQRELLPWPKDNLLYRRAEIPTEEKVHFIERKKYRCPVFLAASTKQKVDVRFCNRTHQRNKKEPILFILHLDEKNETKRTKCFNVRYLGANPFPSDDHKDEFLFAPYSVFTIRSVTWLDDPSVANPHIIHLVVAVDSGQEPEGLPLIYWH